MIAVHRRSERAHSLGEGRQPGEPGGYSCLAGIDECRIEAGSVFERRSHRELLTITYIIDGILDYRDDADNRHLLMGGEVQIVGAGDGLAHSEGNASHSEPLHVVQAWIRCDSGKAKPERCAQKYFSDDAKLDQLCLIASADGRDGSLVLSCDTDVYAAVLRQDDPVLFQRAQKRRVWLQMGRGELRLNDVPLGPGDAAAIDGDEDGNLRFQAERESEFLLFDMP